jgi:hypothetical protein
MNRNFLITEVFFISFLLPSCQPAGNSLYMPSPNVAFTASPSMEPPPTTTGTATATTTPTPALTATPTSTPTVTPTPIAMPRYRIAYASLNGLFLLDWRSPARMINKKDFIEMASFSDDGRKLVYYVGKDWSSTYPGTYTSLRVFDLYNNIDTPLLSGGQIQNLERIDGEPIAGLDLGSLRWIPNTHKIIFSTYPLPPYSITSSEDLFALNTDTGNLVQLFKSGKGGDGYPSPDGKKMTIYRGRKISLSTINGEVVFPDIIEAGGFENPRIVWTADSTKFGTISVDGSKIWSVDATTGIGSILWIVGSINRAELSPTLEYILFAILGSNKNFINITIAKVDGSSPKILYDGESSPIAFSPDGNHFAFYTGRDPRYRPPCHGERPPVEPSVNIVIGSLDGDTVPISSHVNPYQFQWINNTQFIYIQEDKLLLGDIGGYSEILASGLSCVTDFNAKDLDFQVGS